MQPRRVLVALSITQITSWGVLYYAFPVALADISADTGWSPSAATAAFSAGLVVSALAGIPVGRWLDRHGPRLVMTTGSLIAVPATVGIALAPTYPWFVAAWLVAGVAMAAVFYQAAFAALTRWYGPRRVRALTTLTLVAGLSSTVFAPLTHQLLERLSWRTSYLVLALLLALVTIPLHAVALSPPWEDLTAATVRMTARRRGVPAEVRTPVFLLLAGALTLTAFGLYAASLALIPLLTGRGFSSALAATTLGLLGAGQLLGRVAYGPLAARTTPAGRTVAIVAASAATIALLAAVPGPSAVLVAAAVLAGAAGGRARSCRPRSWPTTGEHRGTELCPGTSPPRSPWPRPSPRGPAPPSPVSPGATPRCSACSRSSSPAPPAWPLRALGAPRSPAGCDPSHVPSVISRPPFTCRSPDHPERATSAP